MAKVSFLPMFQSNSSQLVSGPRVVTQRPGKLPSGDTFLRARLRSGLYFVLSPPDPSSKINVISLLQANYSYTCESTCHAEWMRAHQPFSSSHLNVQIGPHSCTKTEPKCNPTGINRVVQAPPAF